VKPAYPEIIERISGELPELEKVVDRAAAAWQMVKNKPEDQDYFLDSVALNLHSFYSGLERIFELIAKRIDQRIMTGQSCHKDLLQIVSQDMVGLRPAVIQPDEVEKLDQFRRFRHLVRNLYTSSLQASKIEGLIYELPKLWKNLQKELVAFVDFLEYIADANKS